NPNPVWRFRNRSRNRPPNRASNADRAVAQGQQGAYRASPAPERSRIERVFRWMAPPGGRRADLRVGTPRQTKRRRRVGTESELGSKAKPTTRKLAKFVTRVRVSFPPLHEACTDPDWTPSASVGEWSSDSISETALVGR